MILIIGGIALLLLVVILIILTWFTNIIIDEEKEKKPGDDIGYRVLLTIFMFLVGVIGGPVMIVAGIDDRKKMLKKV